MGEFTLEIARTAAAVSCLFGSTREYFRNYLSESTPEFSVCVTAEDLVFEQKMLDEEADREGLRRRKFTDPFLERSAVQRKVAAYVLRKDILLLHGSTVAADGAAYLFTAACGVGKSTHTRLWRRMLGNRAVMVNDDRAFLGFSAGEVLAYGSPWSGKHGLDTNICVPLKGICILERGTRNEIRSLSPEAALPILLGQAFLPCEKDGERVRQLTQRLTQYIPLWQATCTKEPGAAEVTYRAMAGKEAPEPVCL